MANRFDMALAFTRYSHPGTGYTTKSLWPRGMLVLYDAETPTGVMACSTATLSRTFVEDWNVRLAFLHLADDWCLFKDALLPTVPPHFRHWTCVCRLSFHVRPIPVTLLLYAAVEILTLLFLPPVMTINSVLVAFIFKPKDAKP